MFDKVIIYQLVKEILNFRGCSERSPLVISILSQMCSVHVLTF
jgi:hypothetical protein